MTNKEHKKILDIFVKNNPQDKSIWIIALNYFLKEYKQNENNQENNFFFKNAISLFLFKLIENEIMSPLNVLQLVNEINSDVPLLLVQSFYLKTIQKENKNFVNDLIKNKEYDATSQEIKDEINTLITKPLDIKLDKCDGCNLKLNTPCTIFKCKHMYHSSCLIVNTNDNNSIHCPKCYVNHETIDEKLNEVNKLYKNLNDIEILENEINKKSDIVKYIEELYGEGLVEVNLNK